MEFGARLTMLIAFTLMAVMLVLARAMSGEALFANYGAASAGTEEPTPRPSGGSGGRERRSTERHRGRRPRKQQRTNRL